MSMTGDYSSTANNNDARERAERALRGFDAPPRSPYEALEPVRPPEIPEREPWRMHPVLAFFNALFMLTLFTACALLVLFFYFRIQFDRPGPLPASTVVVIPKGEGVSHILPASCTPNPRPSTLSHREWKRDGRGRARRFSAPATRPARRAGPVPAPAGRTARSPRPALHRWSCSARASPPTGYPRPPPGSAA